MARDAAPPLEGSEAASLADRIGLVVGSSFVSAGIGMVQAVVLARLLGRAEYGLWALSMVLLGTARDLALAPRRARPRPRVAPRRLCGEHGAPLRPLRAALPAHVRGRRDRGVPGRDARAARLRRAARADAAGGDRKPAPGQAHRRALL